MKTLLLMRHAKSSWSQSDVDDHNRILNARGRAAADTMARWLINRDLVPDHAHVSSAARTCETWTRMTAHLPGPITATYHRSLYLSGPDVMLDTLKGTPDTAQTVLLLAHQPGMSAMTQLMSDGTATDHAARAVSQFPTAAIATLSVQTNRWRALDFGIARVTGFDVPRDQAGVTTD